MALHEYLSQNATWEPVEGWLRRTADRYRVAIEHLDDAHPWLEP